MVKPALARWKALLREYWVEVALVLGVLASHLYVAFTPVNSLLNWFHIDDSFYYFKTAANIAQGLGSTFNGLGRTNGYHPLWMLVLIPVFWFYRVDVFLPLRMVVLLQGLLNAGMGVLVYRTARRSLALWAAVALSFIWSLWPSFFNLVTISGLETTISLFFIALVWNRLVFLNEEENLLLDTRHVQTLGWAAGLMILSRLDNVFLAAAVGLWLLWRWGRVLWREEAAWRRLMSLALSYGLPIVVLLGGYLLWNRLYIGHWMPISSEVKHWWAARGDTVYGFPPYKPYQKFKHAFLNPEGPWGLAYNLIWGMRNWFEVRGWSFLGRLRGALLLVALVVAIPTRRVWVTNRHLLIPVLLTGWLLHTAYYEFSGYVASRDWYWVGEMFVTLLFLVTVAEGYGRLLLRGRWQRAMGLTLTMAVAGTLLWQHGRYITRRYPRTRPADEPAHYYLHRTAWVMEHTPPGTLIGATGAGNLGYFIQDRTVFPLDGLINSYDYFEALQEDRATAYLAGVGLDYVIGKDWVLKLQPYAPIFDGQVVEVARYQYEPSMRMEFLWRFEPEAP